MPSLPAPHRSLARVLAFLLAAWWTVSCPRDVFAQTVSFVQNFSITGNNTQSLSFSKFDPSLGTLTGITLTFTGTTAGTFTVTDQDPDVDTSVNGLTDRLRVIFPALSSGTFLQTPVTTVTGNVTPTLPKVLAEGQTVEFTLASSSLAGMTNANVYAQVGSTNADAYFIGGNPVVGTVTADVRQLFSLNTDAGVAPATNFGNVTTPGAATLTYIYTVPEPSSVALAVVGVGFAAVLATRRRKRLG